MQTIKISNIDELSKYLEYKRYVVNGNLIIESTNDFYIDKPLIVKGSIKSGTFIKAGEYIKAGEWIEAKDYIFSFKFDITTPKMITHTLPFFRKYYAEIPILDKYKDLILNECWGTIRKGISKDDYEMIANYEGFHWHIQEQIKMFLGMIKYSEKFK